MQKRMLTDFKLFQQMLAQGDSDELVVRWLRNAAETISAMLACEPNSGPEVRDRLVALLTEQWIGMHLILLHVGEPLIEAIERRLEFHREQLKKGGQVH